MTPGGLKLRWYQEEAVQALFDYFADPVRANKNVPANPLIALPTGTGKSLVIAEFLRRALTMYPQTRAFMATHVKELIQQNANKMRENWPLAPMGIYSSGLRARDAIQPIIFGGIRSAVGKFPLFGRRDLLVIDEAHLLSPSNDASYQKFIDELTKGGKDADANSHNVNPYLKVIGLTATPYRLGLGPMTNGSIFTDVVYDLCNIDGFARLIAEGYLCPLIPKKTKTQLDVSNVGKTASDFNQGELQAAVDKQDVTFAALQEVVEQGQDRGSWLIFASGVEHAEHIAEMLNSYFGIPTVCIHSKKTQKENDDALEAWKTGKVRAAVNMNSLTTGVDHPPCDLIAMLRPTMSPGLWVQMLGRGTRPYSCFTSDPYLAAKFPYVKVNCLVLDFAGNTRRLGPINDPVIPRMKGQGPPGDAPVRICEKCGTYNHASARICVVCGSEFTFRENLDRSASNLELIRSNLPQNETFKVSRVVVTKHEARSSGRDTLRVAYFCGSRTFFEYISVETPVSFHRHKSRDWFRQRYHYKTTELTWDDDVPATNTEVLKLANQGELRWPKSINVWVNTQNPQVVGYEF